MQRIGRADEFKVVREYNVYEKPSFLTWPQFYTELSAFQITLLFPIQDTSRFTLTALSNPKPQQPQTSKQPLPPQQTQPSRQQRVQPQPQQQQQRKRRGRRGKGGEDKGDEEDDEMLPLSLQQKQQQQNNAKMKLLVQDQKKRQQSQPQPQPQPQSQQKVAKNVVDVGVALKNFALGDLVNCAFDLAYRCVVLCCSVLCCEGEGRTLPKDL